MKKEEWIQRIKGRVPDAALDYCFSLWEEKPFQFVISRSRSSKLGDFRFRRDQPVQKITINHDLNPYQFLITYIHEVAHHRVYASHSIRCMPHGVEWKRASQELMFPMIDDKTVFPVDILIPLRRHMHNPKASSGADLFLMKELRKYDIQDPDRLKTLLSDIKLGEKFELKQRVFQKLESRRTRVLCLEVATGKKYLISSHAAVKSEKGKAKSEKRKAKSEKGKAKREKGKGKREKGKGKREKGKGKREKRKGKREKGKGKREKGKGKREKGKGKREKGISHLRRSCKLGNMMLYPCGPC